jgi:hypothetical protein
VTGQTSGPVTKAQALAYARAVNLQAGDLPDFASNGSETEGPEPGRDSITYSRCSGGPDRAGTIAKIDSTEFSAGRGFYGKVMKSTVEVWPTPGQVVLNQKRFHSPRGRACFVGFLNAVHKRINRERKGRAQYGPFTVKTVLVPMPGVSHGFLTTINETRLLRSGAIRAHIYRDIFGFIAGAAEIELEGVGFGHPVPSPAEERALLLLVGRARANGNQLRPTNSG